MINEFRGEYFFLSNFYNAPVTYGGITYQNNETAFQAQKTLNENEKHKFSTLPPNVARRKGRKAKLRPDWEEVKDQIMYEICLAKFTQNEDLKEKLLNTNKEHLEEGNNWGDTYWGTVNGIGRNALGKILMHVRNELYKTTQN